MANAPEQPIGGGRKVTPPAATETFRPIDEWDWFLFFRNWLTTSDDRLKNQAANIQSAVQWFFTVATSTTIVSFVIKDPKPNMLSSIFFSVSLILLFIAYGIAVVTYSTLSRRVGQPNSAAEIQAEFNRSNERSKRLLWCAAFCLVLGMGLFPASILSLYQKPIPPTPTENIVGSFTIKTGKDKIERFKSIDVSGSNGDANFLYLRLEKGKSLANASVVTTFKHALAHSAYDMTFNVDSCIAFEKNMNYYLVRVTKGSPDSLKMTSCKLQR